MKATGGRLILEMLKLHGVRHVFGLPGETTLGLYREWVNFSGIEHILTHDERSAAYMAEAYAKATGRVGVSEAPSPGVSHPLPGVLESNVGSVPTICFTSDVPYNNDKRNMLSGVDQNEIFKGAVKESILITKAADIPHLVRRAFRVALSDRPGAVHVRVPMDVYTQEVEVHDVYADPAMAEWPQDRPLADSGRIDEAIRLLLSAERPVIVCGQGAMVSGAGEAVRELAELLSIPVGCTMTGKGTIAETHPLSIRLIGARGGTSFANRFLEEADLVFFVGSNTDSAGTDAWKLPPRCGKENLKIIQLDISRVEAGNNYHSLVNLVGDARATVAEIVARLRTSGAKGRSTYTASDVAAAMGELERSIAPCAASDEAPVHPIRFVRELAGFIPEKSMVVTEPSMASIFSAAYMVQKNPGRWFLSNYSMGALGYVVPAVVGAAFARPDHTIVGVGGDGSFLFNCGEMETWARYNLDVKYVVFNNNVFGWIRGEIEHVYNSSPFATNFGYVDYCKIAEGMGVKSFRIEEPSQIAGVLSEAFAKRGPVLIELRAKSQDVECPPVPRWIPNARNKGIPFHY
ncbi:thiamine pyrophosphate-binding protein [Synergistaceae bacterium OttesenSCG-928-I11]|nr:thiamine pyrophosphate-binding protein [Synergistaceae bacterium OttesenSCG-928-I11]